MTAKTGENSRPRNDEIIDYSLRPAKSIERKMLCTALSRLAMLSVTKSYQYIGFGSTYFVDFSLFHKVLGIEKLISIEGDTDMEARVKFNSPYSCIDVKMGQSTEKLPEVEWENQKSILWLDYTSSLTGYMFSDMATFFSRAVSGSVFIISINVEIKDEVGNKTNSARIKSKLEKDVDVKKRIRKSSLRDDLTKDEYYTILRDVIHLEIKEILIQRNRVETEQVFDYQQIFNFLYHDGQAMLTIGGILFNQEDAIKVSNMSFDNLEFYKQGKEYFEIVVPHLTNREVQALDKYLPSFNSDPTVKKEALSALKNVISESAIEKYAKVYQYFPSYKEVIL